jgi:hypothetical protein
MDPAQASLAFQVITDRYDYRRSTCITTNRLFKDWPKVFPDALNAQVIAERLTERAERFICELAAFEHHAEALSCVVTFEDLTDLDPNARHVFKAPIGAELARDVARSRTVEMYHRYAAEIRRFLTVNRPTLRSRTSRPAKEVDRDLFAATR